MSEQGVDLQSSLLLQELSGPRNGVRSVDDIVDQDANSVLDVSYQHHSRVSMLAKLRRSSFLWEKSDW